MAAPTDRATGPGPALPGPPVSPGDRQLARLRARLLAWFDAHARTLPWRAPKDAPPTHPYAVWVSEIMLQQTRVDTVLRYYERFMARFPSTEALAAASEDEVMSAWSGLGYYRRARLLHAGVREVVARYGGKVPEDADARRRLPGVGRYTAGAIGSIAFGRPEPLVDGNVMRVFARLFRIETPLGRRDTEAAMWAVAERLVEGQRPGDLNQALMELGALVCTKGAPDCGGCPVRDDCAARAAGCQEHLPVSRAKKAPRPVSVSAVLATAERGKKVWLQRSSGALFGGLWNLPMAEGDAAAAARAALSGAGLGGRLPAQPTAAFEHVLTHRRLQVSLFRTSARAGAAVDGRGDLRLVAAGDLPGLGISTLTRKALAAGGFG